VEVRITLAIAYTLAHDVTNNKDSASSRRTGLTAHLGSNPK